MLKTDPATVEMTLGEGVNFSNYVGYCLARPAMENDVGLQEAMQLLEEKLQRHGYVGVTQDELLAERGLLSNTFVAYFSYAQYFEEGEIEVRLVLYELSAGAEQDRAIWAWRSRVKEYPISRANMKAVMEDIFETAPMWRGGDERLLPRMSADRETVARFKEALERARGRVRLGKGEGT